MINPKFILLLISGFKSTEGFTVTPSPNNSSVSGSLTLCDKGKFTSHPFEKFITDSFTYSIVKIVYFCFFSVLS